MHVAVDMKRKCSRRRFAHFLGQRACFAATSRASLMNLPFCPINPPRAGRKLLSLTLILALGACTTTKNDSARTRREGATAGAVGGALLGAGAGALLGGKNKKNAMLAGAAAGALVGAAAGTAYGDSVAKKKEGYAQTEDALGAQLRSAQRELSNRHIFNEGVKNEIARHQQRLASLQAPDHATGRAVEEFELRSTLANRIGELDREARSWQATIDAHKEALRQARSDPRAATLRKDINGLEAERSQLLRQKRELITISDRAK
jgi:hypothetical protein